MSTTQAIEFHRNALLRVVMLLFVRVGIAPNGAGVATLPQVVQRAILRILGPAESAARRLIVLRSREMAVLSPNAIEEPARSSDDRKSGNGDGAKDRAPVFWLFDRRKYFAELADRRRRVSRGPGPRMFFFDGDYPDPEPASDSEARDPDDAVRLCRRLQALHGALDDMPAQAKRLLRVMARRKVAPPGPRRYGPIRPGWPLGYRKNWAHEVDQILYDCHVMARTELASPDTS